MYFFKVFLPQFSAERMLVPKAFTNHLKRPIPKEITLRRHSGRCWHMKAISCDGGVYLQDGWKKFLQDNSIETADFLVFQYHGHHILDVIVMGRSGCEKKERVLPHIKEEEEEEENVGLRGGREAPYCVLEEEDEDGDEDNDEDDDDDYEVEEEEEEDENEGEDEDEEEKKNDYEDSEDCEYQDGEQDREEEENEANMVQCNEAKKGGEIGKHNGAQKGESSTGMVKSTEAAQQEVFEPLRYIQTNNPCFIAQSRTLRRSLYVPLDIIKDYQLKLYKEIDFEDPNGRWWPGELNVWKDGRIWIRGWGLVCRRNNVQPNDVCICELPLGQGVAGRVVKVHIFREGGIKI